MEVGCLRHPRASTIGSQLLDGDRSQGWQILATQPWAPTPSRRIFEPSKSMLGERGAHGWGKPEPWRTPKSEGTQWSAKWELTATIKNWKPYYVWAGQATITHAGNAGNEIPELYKQQLTYQSTLWWLNSTSNSKLAKMSGFTENTLVCLN